MRYSYSIFKVENGYGYSILDTETPFIYQYHDPDRDGFYLMDEETAVEKATNVLERLFRGNFSVETSILSTDL